MSSFFNIPAFYQISKSVCVSDLRKDIHLLFIASSVAYNIARAQNSKTSLFQLTKIFPIKPCNLIQGMKSSFKVIHGEE